MKAPDKPEWKIFGQVDSLSNLKAFLSNPSGKLLTKENHELIIIPEGIEGLMGLTDSEIYYYIAQYDIGYFLSVIKSGEATDRDYYKVVEMLLSSQILWSVPSENKEE